MASRKPPSTHERSRPIQDDLRSEVADQLLARLDAITADTVAIFPYSGTDTLDAGYCGRVGRQLAQLLASAVRDGVIDPRGALVAELNRAVLDRGLAIERLFTFAYLTERTALDELASDERIGATSEPWPLVAQLVRRASFDFLGAYVERSELAPGESAITDKLTTLYTRPLFDAVLSKELERASRYGYPMSLILFDVDHLATINQKHGYGVGDKILERLGILIRTYFRQHDWVARHAEDSIAILLTRINADQASDLAEHVTSTVSERLGFTNHLTDQPVSVSVSGSIINMIVGLGDVVDTERLMADAESALNRAKQHGRNRMERVDGYAGTQSSRTPT